MRVEDRSKNNVDEPLFLRFSTLRPALKLVRVVFRAGKASLYLTPKIFPTEKEKKKKKKIAICLYCSCAHQGDSGLCCR